MPETESGHIGTKPGNIFNQVFQRACAHIESVYVDRLFVTSEWPSIRIRYSQLLESVIDRENFELLMTDLIQKNLRISHSQFITPELSTIIESQENNASAPEFLYPILISRPDHIYIKISSLTIPIFSWLKLEPQLKKLQDDPRPIILDFRLNAGGAASAVGQLLSPFIGANKPFLFSRLFNWQDYSQHVVYPQEEVGNRDNRLDVEITMASPNIEWRTLRNPEFRLNQKVIILIDSRTYSCGELFVQAMKEQTNCVLIGGLTAGAVVGARDDFECGYGYRLLLPYVNLVSARGVILEGVGVVPDIEYRFTSHDTAPLNLCEVETVQRIAHC